MIINKTIDALLKEILNSSRIKEKLLNNLNTQCQTEIVLNLVELVYSFDTKTVEIIYFVKDTEYPNTILNFSEFNKLIS